MQETKARLAWITDYEDVLTEITQEYPTLSAKEQLEKVVESFVRDYIPGMEKKLLRLYCLPDISQDDLDSILAEIDIETLNSETVLLLAYMTKKFPHLSFGDINSPRLKGLLQYYRFRNLEQFTHFSKIVGKMNENAIIPLIMKGGAMKYLRPDLPRLMGDLDIVVATEPQWKSCKTIVEAMNYTVSHAEHSMDVHLPGQDAKELVHIHKKIPLFKGDGFVEELFENASLKTIYKVKCYVPSDEDLAFLIIINLSRNLRFNTSLAGLPFSIIDLLYLSTRNGFCWEKIGETAESNDLVGGLYFATAFINSIVPGLVPQITFSGNNLDLSAEKYLKHELKRVKWKKSFGMKCYKYCEEKVYSSAFLRRKTKSVAVLDFIYKTMRKILVP